MCSGSISLGIRNVNNPFFVGVVATPLFLPEQKNDMLVNRKNQVKDGQDQESNTDQEPKVFITLNELDRGKVVVIAKHQEHGC